jgi:hypothetical protein
MVPNATAIISTHPGKRVTAISEGITAALCLREMVRKAGHVSDSGLAAQPFTRLLFLRAAFGTARDVADMIMIDGVPSVVVSLEQINFDTITRAEVLLLSDAATINGVEVACQINAISNQTTELLSGLLVGQQESLVTHADVLAAASAAIPVPGDSVRLPDGKLRSVDYVSTDNTGKVLSIILKSKGVDNEG